MILSLSLLSSFNVLSQSSWELDKQNNGITVYTRSEKDSNFKSFKAQVLVNAEIEEVCKVLKEVNNYINWFGYTRTSKTLKKEEDFQYVYVETIFPWPYANRDMVYKMSFEEIDTNEILILLKGIPNYLAEIKGVLRMEKANGSILIKSQGEKTEVIYTFHSEPGGNIPIWLANNSIAELPYKTLLGLRKQLSNEPLLK